MVDINTVNIENLSNSKMAFIQPEYYFNTLESAHALDKYSSIRPNYGALQLLAFAKERKLFKDLRYFEGCAFKDETALQQAVKDYFAGENGVIGSTCYTSNIDIIRRLFNSFHNSHLKIVGGPHISSMPDTSFAHIAVLGEGELTLEEIVKKYPNMQNILTGIAYEKGNRKIVTRS